jgi:hypothetical protein
VANSDISNAEASHTTGLILEWTFSFWGNEWPLNLTDCKYPAVYIYIYIYIYIYVCVGLTTQGPKQEKVRESWRKLLNESRVHLKCDGTW